MKSINGFIIFLLVLILISSLTFAVGSQGSNQSGKGTESNESDQGQQIQIEQETQNMGEEENLTIREQLRARNVSELKQMIQERQQEMNQELQNLGEDKQKVYQNQNRVMLAVHALLSMENLTGGIGRNISQIAREFNNSVQATIRAEERIQIRNWFVRIFAGGDEGAANDIEQEINRNNERIRELIQLKENCSCDEEVRAMLQEQIQNMEQEQNRLQNLAQNEKKDKGIFGWMFGWLKK